MASSIPSEHYWQVTGKTERRSRRGFLRNPLQETTSFIPHSYGDLICLTLADRDSDETAQSYRGTDTHIHAECEVRMQKQSYFWKLKDDSTPSTRTPFHYHSPIIIILYYTCQNKIGSMKTLQYNKVKKTNVYHIGTAARFSRNCWIPWPSVYIALKLCL